MLLCLLVSIYTLIAVSEQELVWANGEENPNFFTLFGKFAELQWIYNDAAKCMANKVSAQSRVLIFDEYT